MDKVSLLAGSTLTTSNYLLTKLWTFVVITVKSCVSLEQCRVAYWTKRVQFLSVLAVSIAPNDK
jgi:hypothetical protein